jgi:predicted phage tail protein
VSVRCNDANKTWNIKGIFTYSGSGESPDTVNSSQPCTVKNTTPNPPNTKITKSKIDKKRKQAKFWFKATGSSTGFQCKLSGKGQKGAFRSCDSPKKYKRLKKGKYTFQVRAVGPGGKDASPAKETFKIKKKHKRHHKHHTHHHHKHHHHGHHHGH